MTRVLLTGSSGQLGAYLIEELIRAGVSICAWSGSRAVVRSGIPLQPVDLGRPDDVAAAYRAFDPSAVIHAAALSSIAECVRDPERARAINVRGTEVLADLSRRSAARFVYTSTDLVFDGERGPYREHDRAGPLSVYGRTKWEAEAIARDVPRGLVARLSLLYGPSRTDRPSFFDQQVSACRGRRPLTLFEDEWRSPLDLATAARALVAATLTETPDLLHIGGPERMSRVEMGRRVARCLGLDSDSIASAQRLSAPFAEPRPRDCSLDSSQWRSLFPEQEWPKLEIAVLGMFSATLSGKPPVAADAFGTPPASAGGSP
jgi:dTDP-4-dehydrorhamnose reductase